MAQGRTARLFELRRAQPRRRQPPARLERRDGRRPAAGRRPRRDRASGEAQAALAKTEEALRQSQKMEALGQLTGGIAHDFNNLLTGILGAMDIMKRRIASGRLEDVQRFMDAASTSAHRAAALTHRLLAFARRQPLDPRPGRCQSADSAAWRTCCAAVLVNRYRWNSRWPRACGRRSPTPISLRTRCSIW